MVPQNNLEGPVKFFAENRAAHITAVFGAVFSGILFGVRGVRAQGWQRAGWLALFALQIVQVIGLIRLRRTVKIRQTPISIQKLENSPNEKGVIAGF